MAELPPEGRAQQPKQEDVLSDDSTAYTGWAVVELMGHRRIAGHVSEAAQYGTAMIRIDVPTEDGQPPITQFYGGNSIYCLSPVTEDVARAVARRNQPAPVSPYEILPPKAMPAPMVIDPDLEDDEERYNDEMDAR